MVTELPGPVVADPLNLHLSTIDRCARSLAAPRQNDACRPAMTPWSTPDVPSKIPG